MNTLKQVSATPHTTQWHSIDWKYLHRKVRKLQIRIAKATLNKGWRKVKSLQRMLVRSFSAKVIAVKRVTENTGRKTPGVDNQLWNTPKSKWEAISQLKRKGYHPKPLRRIDIPKENGKVRPLSIPTMKDRAMQALYLLALEPVAETTADRNSYGFRPIRSAADAIEQTFICLNRKVSAQWILEGDIKECFNNISHQWLLDNIPMDKKILRKWLKAGYIEKGTFHHTQVGTSQGGSISPVLANMCLDGIERIFSDYPFMNINTKKVKKSKVNYVRFADDFICTAHSKELLEQQVKPMITEFLSERGLTLSEEKTAVTHIEEGFDFLGQNVRKYKGKLLIKPSKKNLKRCLKKVRSTIEGNKTATVIGLIYLLNPLIRGWANYHQHIVAKETYQYVDHQIWRKIWQWCRRRHPNKGKRWVAARYFKTSGMRRWVFYGKDKEGKERQLYSASSTPIVRHIKIKSEANFYNTQWEPYFEERSDRKWLKSQRGKKKVTMIWEKQHRICPRCKQRFTEETGWHVHHKVKKMLGGGDEMSNLILLHPNCHRQLHSNETGSPNKGELIKA